MRKHVETKTYYKVLHKSFNLWLLTTFNFYIGFCDFLHIWLLERQKINSLMKFSKLFWSKHLDSRSDGAAARYFISTRQAGKISNYCGRARSGYSIGAHRSKQLSNWSECWSCHSSCPSAWDEILCPRRKPPYGMAHLASNLKLS